MALLHRLKMLRHEIQQNVKRVKNSKLSNMKLISNYYICKYLKIMKYLYILYKSKAYFILQDTTILNVNFKCPWSGQQPCKVPQGQSKVKCFIFSVQVSSGNKCEYQTN